jgi:GDPmannose 4,6-dehydratase|tara:strand:+ start:27668 stop:28681 length:1014 start_codon:yes stop_codon:yes gene_type:complete
MQKKAFITGITGQDGSYLAEFLLNKGYEVHGLIRRVALENPSQRLKRINHIKDKLTLHPGNIESYSRLIDIFDKVQPDECYHLASQSFVYESFEDSFSTFITNIQGTLNIITALQNRSPKCKFYFAGSSEMFGKVQEIPQTEKTPFHPRSPYGITKVNGFDLTRNFRESSNIFACSGILFNHESPRRGREFVTRKITSSITKVKENSDFCLELGNIDAKRDWGFAGDYIEAMWLMLQQENPDDYVISTGETHTVREFVEEAFKVADIYPIEWHGEGINEIGMYNGKVIIRINKEFFRPSEVDILIGDLSKARSKLGWEPKTKFKDLVRMMVEEDLKK